jgi:hypothetical protein
VLLSAVRGTLDGVDLIPTPEGRWRETAPGGCTECSHTGQGWAIVGWQACRCQGHRTHTCQRCEHEQYTPPLSEGCGDVPMGFTG